MKEAKLIALACSKPPKGRARWTLRLLERKVVELKIVARASDLTIGRVLKKNTLKPHRRQCWVIPPKANSTFVAAMEDVLAVTTRPRDPDRPLVCLDETSKQLTAETRLPVPMKPGRPARCDYEYERNGTANLFMLFAPLEGWRHVKVTDRHTAVDYAHVLKDLADAHFAAAKVIVLVQDNLSTHGMVCANCGALPRDELVEKLSVVEGVESDAALFVANAKMAECAIAVCCGLDPLVTVDWGVDEEWDYGLGARFGLVRK